MHEIPAQTLTSDAFPITPQPQLKTGAENNGFYSLATMSAEAPYQVPKHVDFGRIESLLAAQESAAQDHLWTLREDPGYFASTQREMIEHRQELIKDINGKPWPILSGPQSQIFRANVISILIAEAFVPVNVFSDLRRQAQELRALQTKYARIISPSTSLPEDFLYAILRFRQYLRGATNWPMARLKFNAFGSPPLRQFYVRYPPPVDAPPTKVIVGLKPELKLDNIESRLLMALTMLWDEGLDVFFFQLPLAMDNLDRLLSSEQRAKDLSEANLDGFWACIDKLAHSAADDFQGTAVQLLLSQPRIIQRTLEWVEPIKKSKIIQTTDHNVEKLQKPLSALHFGISPSKTTSTDTPLAKTKTKTRGVARATLTVAEDPSPPDSRLTSAVDARALKVFHTLFFNPSPTAVPGEVAWNDFLHALTSTGFSAEKLYSSVWQFRPVALSVDRSIQFHQPHPSGKIPFRDARRHGRRLNRAYGWCGETFVLKEK
ncbi:hypothetical protein DHEL01_v204824 [Diaporthe helianthi]|uniref:Uncharacterized protein n=1 Tax=Diaporthe helianthi TaxID=158607 RepID=A0A2P5I2U0_DIAHE|nr:hypothetical protein DHEL01_v204824 [Diaporthe helianthi]